MYEYHVKISQLQNFIKDAEELLKNGFIPINAPISVKDDSIITEKFLIIQWYAKEIK